MRDNIKYTYQEDPQAIQTIFHAKAMVGIYTLKAFQVLCGAVMLSQPSIIFLHILHFWVRLLDILG